MKDKIIVILGPTAVGKTKLSIELAKRYNAEIINADSMQVYKTLNIGTAKIKEEEKEGIPHHLFDFVPIDSLYTICDFQKDCRKTIKEIKDRGHNVIIVGGSGLYIKAALFDYRFLEEKENNLFSNLTNEEILTKIKEIDKDVSVHVNNRKRLVRLLNKYQLGGQKEQNGQKLLYDAKFIGLTTSRDNLYQKIDERVVKMINEGLIEEVKKVEPYKNTKALLTGIGYKEVFPYLENKQTLEETIALIQKNSRHYAKRQYTFFNNQFKINWINVNYDDFSLTIEEANKFII